MKLRERGCEGGRDGEAMRVGEGRRETMVGVKVLSVKSLTLGSWYGQSSYTEVKVLCHTDSISLFLPGLY